MELLHDEHWRRAGLFGFAPSTSDVAAQGGPLDAERTEVAEKSSAWEDAARALWLEPAGGRPVSRWPEQSASAPDEQGCTGAGCAESAESHAAWAQDADHVAPAESRQKAVLPGASRRGECLGSSAYRDERPRSDLAHDVVSHRAAA